MAVEGDPPERLRIVQATPSVWGSGTEVDHFVRRVSLELARRGHRVAVIAPSESRAAMRRGARQVKDAAEDPESLFGADGEVTVLPIGGAPQVSSRGRRTPVSGEAARLIQRVLASVEVDIVHVHDPFAPSVPSTALRHSFALNVGTFHLPHERLLSTQVARPLVEIFLGRLDARTVTHRATGELLERYFPGSYELVGPGALAAADEVSAAGHPATGGAASTGRSASPTAESAGPEGHPLRIFYRATEERAALRLFIRALRRLPADLDWRATVVLPPAFAATPRVNARLRERIKFVRDRSRAGSSAATSAAPSGVAPADPPPADTAPADPALSPGGHDILCLASTGAAPTPSAIPEALARGIVPVAADIPVYADLVEEGPLGVLFPPGDADTLAGQIARCARERAGGASTDGVASSTRDGEPPELSLRETRARGLASPVAERSWSVVADDLERIYRAILARRHPLSGNDQIRKRLAPRKLIEVDLHMHTDHSFDCATPVRVLLETARDRGLGAIAITDHNEVSGALAAREIAAGMDGIEVIVAEEVKTAEQGEVIGLFIEEKIPRGMTMAETIAEIRRQGGLVYMPHPFDRLHSVPDYEHLVDVVEEIDFMEVFNPRVAIDAFNEEAERFARKYRIIPAAGSDSHVAQGLGSVRVRIPEFDGPEEFREAMRDAEITRRHKNLVYVQALKFLQTTGRPRAAKRELAAAAPVRGGRPRRRG